MLPVVPRRGLALGTGASLVEREVGGREGVVLALLLPCCRLLRGRLLLVLITNLVKPDIHDVSVEFRPRRHREAQSLLDIDELDMGLAWRNGYRNPLEFGHDGLGLRTLAHHRIAQRNLDLPELRLSPWGGVQWESSRSSSLRWNRIALSFVNTRKARGDFARFFTEQDGRL